jgi:hypothetical protein
VHSLTASFVLAYHGCDRAVGERILQGEPFLPSENDYDWLGSGIYFWEANPDRARAWARRLANDHHAKGETYEPFVIGAAIDLGFCLDLMTSNGTNVVAGAYDLFKSSSPTVVEKLANTGGVDKKLRNLDCAVINYLHQAREKADMPAFDSVRGLFPEGKELYMDSGFRLETHVQICVRNQDLIHGVFRVADRYFSL